MDVGGVGLAVGGTAVLVVMARVVVGMRYDRSSMFEGSKVLVIENTAIAGATVVTKQRLVKHKDWALVRRC